MKHNNKENKIVKVKENKILTTRKEIALRLITLMQKHISRQNAISKDKLFVKLFNKQYEDSNLADYIGWDFCKKAMHMLRVRTKCFVASERRGTEQVYFIVRDEEDADAYIDMLNNNIRKMKYMQKRAMIAVHQKWYALATDDNLKLLGTTRRQA